VTGRTRLAVVGALASALGVLTLAPVTQEHDWLVPAAIAIAIVAAVGLGLRRLGVPPPLVIVAQVTALVLWLGVLVAADVAWFGVVPTVSWARRMGIVFTDGISAVLQYAAPIAVTRGILLLLVGGAGLVALLVDFFAVGLRRAPLTGIPLGAVYAVSASVVPDGLAWYWFVFPATGFLAVLVAEGRTRVVRWGRSAGPSATHTGIPETDSLARNGRRVGAVAVAAAVAIPALLPGLTEGVFGRGGGSGEGGGRTIHTDNPIVDLQGDLTRPENVPVLRYETTAQVPEYIRRVTLDVFDGEEWQTSDRSVPDSQRVSEGMPPPPGLDPPDDGTLQEYRFSTGDNYESSWLPLPYPAQEIDIDGDWRYDFASLDVVSPERNARGVDYVVQSLEIDYQAAELIAAAPASEDFAELRALPDDLPAEVAALARELTADATSAFERAAILQAFFRADGGFVYDLQTEPGNSTSALVNFLQNRRGFCEQFAASMAVMARAVGIPARVAVGFTPGTPQEDGSWVVGTHDAHAWPELYFHGTGWVRFEPTPTTRTGSVPSWTVRPAVGEDGSPAVPNVPEGQGNNADAPVPGLEDPDLGAGTDGGASGVSTAIAIALAVAGGSLVLAVPTVIAGIRRAWRWRRAGGNPVEEAEAAWSDLRDTSRDAGFEWDPAATPRQTGQDLAARAKLDPDSGDLLAHLVTTTERARYSTTPNDTEGLQADSAMLRRTVLRSRPLLQRFGAAIWPSATRDAMISTANRVADGLDWTDAAGARVRERAGELVGRRR
jgi:transglutaminase-like putative cysteine protease